MMSAYFSVDEFRETYPDFDRQDSKIAELLSLASIKADELTFGRIKGAWERLTPFQLSKLREFIFRQAIHIDENGYDGDSDISSYSAGSVSVTLSEGQKTQAELMRVDPAALACLKKTGLMQRGI